MTDTRENEAPSVCENCDQDWETCGCEEQDCLETMREEWLDGMRDAHD